MRGRLLAALAAALLAAGCDRSTPTAPRGSGAREVAQAFFEAIVHQEWDRAYANLTAEGRGRVGADQFRRRGQAYRRRIGFEPASVQVWACEEHGDRAVAHLTLSGRGGHHQRYKEAAELRREAGGWRVVLPPHFGS